MINKSHVKFLREANPKTGDIQWSGKIEITKTVTVSKLVANQYPEQAIKDQISSMLMDSVYGDFRNDVYFLLAHLLKDSNPVYWKNIQSLRNRLCAMISGEEI